MELDVSFSKDVFMKDDFDVDRFLQESCQKSGLHKLHKELGMYIKYLQSMIVDLVNNESNAIVNLSSDLKILQNKFNNLSTPLGQFREEILQMYKMIDTNLSNMKYLLNKKDVMSAEKSRKMNELRMLATSQKIESILESHTNDNDIEMEVIERSVNQYILQHMFSELCDSKNYNLETTEKLYRVLNNIFLKSQQENNSEKCTRCLQMYVLMSAQDVAEDLYRVEVVRPAFHKIINGQNLKSCGGDLSKVYDKILDFIETNTSYLLNLIEKREEIKSFNFILNSVWWEASEQLKVNLSEIYAPGNPSVFQLRFRQTCNFLYELEARIGSSFRTHDTYRTHYAQWNLSVYFEIRHLEIVESYEKSLTNLISNDIVEEKSQIFRIVPFKCAWSAMEKCYSEEIFLPQLLDKFWKLTLQIISRLNVWVKNILNSNVPVQHDPEHSEHVANLKLKFLTLLHTDIKNLISNLSTDLSFTQNYIPEVLIYRIKQSLDEFSKTEYPKNLNLIENIIIDNIYKDCSQHVKNVSQIPRLFRKTNRSSPTHASSYVNAMCHPANSYQAEYTKFLTDESLREILRQVHGRVTREYVKLVRSVLTSVAKTEESLRRLKKTREPHGATLDTTDDQKIRAQLHIDVNAYSSVAEKYCDVSELVALVKDVTPPRDVS